MFIFFFWGGGRGNYPGVFGGGQKGGGVGQKGNFLDLVCRCCFFWGGRQTTSALGQLFFGGGTTMLCLGAFVAHVRPSTGPMLPYAWTAKLPRHGQSPPQLGICLTP